MPAARTTVTVPEYESTWRANARSTEPADRPRAEAAIRTLYAGKGDLRIQWVPSPAAGMVVAAFAAQTRNWIRGTHTRGDVGSGARREWHALAQPFDLEPAWHRRLEQRLESRLTGLPVADRARLTSGDTANLWGAIRAALSAPPVAADAMSAPYDSAEIDGGAIDDLAARLLGDGWTAIVGMTGIDLARELFVATIQTTASETIAAFATSRDARQAMQPGQFDAETPRLAAIRDVFGDPLWRQLHEREWREDPVDARLELARSAGPWWALDGLAIVAERPLAIHLDDRGRLHSADGPAVAWGDGAEVWAWHGVQVDRRAITEPGSISIEEIDGERNVERRRVLVERFGEERLVREGGGELVHEDDTGRLWRRNMQASEPWWHREEPVVMVEVLNSTPEPDGSRKTYFLRVPPDISVAREAVAWTFGLSFETYAPAIET